MKQTITPDHTKMLKDVALKEMQLEGDIIFCLVFYSKWGKGCLRGKIDELTAIYQMNSFKKAKYYNSGLLEQLLFHKIVHSNAQ